MTKANNLFNCDQNRNIKQPNRFQNHYTTQAVFEIES